MTPFWSLFELALRVLRPALAVGAAVGLAALAGPSASALASEDAKQCLWRKAFELQGAVFEDVAVSDGIVWAVGYKGHRKTFPVISRWDGTNWVTDVADLRGKHEQVLARSVSDVWLSGKQNGEWVLQSFDGHDWRTERRAVDFANVANPRDVWMSEGQRLISIHMDGSQSEVAVPASIEYWGQFAVDLHGGVWIDDDSYFYRWNGGRWVRTRHPADSDGGGVMAASTSNDVWSVGNSILHWDGASLKRVRHGGEYQVMHDVDALRGSALLVGQDWGRTNGHGVITEWDGMRIRKTTYLGSRASAVTHTSTVEAIMGVAFATNQDAWAVGYGGFGDHSVGVVFRGTCQW